MTNELGWMLDEAVRMPHAHHALLLTADGMLRGRTRGITRDQADRMAAALSGLQSIARSTADFLNPDSPPPLRQVLIEFAGGYVFLVAAGEGAYLAVSADAEVDMEAVSFRMHKLVDRLRKELTAPARQDTGAGA